MLQRRPSILWRVLPVLAGVVILRVTAEVVLGYRNYFPPNFSADFLRGREDYFFDRYRWPFYAHLVSGPMSLLLGMMLLSDRFRARCPQWHRRLGRIQVACVLLLVAPSGLWMAWDTSTGPIAGAGFALLAILTGVTIALGWRAAVRRQFVVHRLWMERCFLLLSSAVVIRIFGGLGTTLEVQAEWFDPVISWASWVVPLLAYELGRVLSRGSVRITSA